MPVLAAGTEEPPLGHPTPGPLSPIPEGSPDTHQVGRDPLESSVCLGCSREWRTGHTGPTRGTREAGQSPRATVFVQQQKRHAAPRGSRPTHLHTHTTGLRNTTAGAGGAATEEHAVRGRGSCHRGASSRGRGELPRRSTQSGAGGAATEEHAVGGGGTATEEHAVGSRNTTAGVGGELPWRSMQSGPVHGRQTQSSDEARPKETRGGNGKWSPGVQGFCASVKKFWNQVAMAAHHQERTLLRCTLLLYKTTHESHHRAAQSGWWVTGGYR